MPTITIMGHQVHVAARDAYDIQVDGRSVTIAALDRGAAAADDLRAQYRGAVPDELPADEYDRVAASLVHRALAAEARRQLTEQARHDHERRLERYRQCSGHRPAQTSDARCFAGAVSPDENPMAHGGVMYTDTCRCGAVRHVNVNGCHEETGHWHCPAGEE